MCIKVDFPEPEGPMMATNSPDSIEKFMSCKTGVTTSSLTDSLSRPATFMSGIALAPDEGYDFLSIAQSRKDFDESAVRVHPDRNFVLLVFFGRGASDHSNELLAVMGQEGALRHGKHVFALAGHDAHIGSESGANFGIAVYGSGDLVVHDAGDYRRGRVDLGDHTAVVLVRPKSVKGYLHVLPGDDSGDIRFADIGFEMEVVHVLQNHHGREGGRQLAGFDTDTGDGPAGGRAQDSIFIRGLGRLDLALGCQPRAK